MRTAHHGAVTWYTGEMASLGGWYAYSDCG